MTIEGRHLAVIMARGDSTRMGLPKGLCQLHGRGDPLAVRVARLYNDLGVPVLLIVRLDDQLAYEDLLCGENVEIHAAPRGGDTALTMQLAWEWSLARGTLPEYLWAHPVDLPLVHPQTILQLAEAAREDGESAWRPYHADDPGHPVIIPAPLLERVLGVEPLGKTMSSAWKNAISLGLVFPMKKLAVDDSGTITDFDTPEQLNSLKEPKESES